jgi:hypothetical protein
MCRPCHYLALGMRHVKLGGLAATFLKNVSCVTGLYMLSDWTGPVQ